MNNNQTQSQIQYKTRVKEREIRFFEKINISAGKSLKEIGGAQYRWPGKRGGLEKEKKTNQIF